MAKKMRYLQKRKDCFGVLVGRQTLVFFVLLLLLILAYFVDAQSIGEMLSEWMDNDFAIEEIFFYIRDIGG